MMLLHSEGTITKTMSNVFVDKYNQSFNDKPIGIVIRTTTFLLRYTHAIMLAPKLSQVSSQVYSDVVW